MFLVDSIRKDFPFLQKKDATTYIYFDNAATTQKPQQVIEAISNFYAYNTSNVFRSMYLKAEQITSFYEQARSNIASFIGADSSETIFTSGTTEGINFVASTYGTQFLKAGDEIIISQMEHHANFLPWQQLSQRTGIILSIIPITVEGLLDMKAYETMLSSKTKLVAIAHSSNVLGTTNDVALITRLAHSVGARVLIDAAQSAPHMPLNLHDIGVDFAVFSGHKMLGPTGIGVLYIKKELHELVNPYQFGGGMVSEVCREHSCWALAPHKFEAGTPPIVQAIGLSSAIDYLREKVNFNFLRQHETALVSRAIEGLQSIPGIRILGPIDQLKERGHLISFVVDKLHAHDVAAFLDAKDISVAVRAGQQCAQPLHALLGLPASIRISFYCYNTLEEVDSFIDKMKLLYQM